MTDTPETILSQLSFANRSLERGDWKGASEEQYDRLLSLLKAFEARIVDTEAEAFRRFAK